MDSLNETESGYLDSYSNNKQEETHKKASLTENESIFEDDNGKFRFDLKNVKCHRNRKDIIGTLYVPDMKHKGKMIKGRLEGKISKYRNGNISLFFESVDKNDSSYDIFEFCDGIEYELDSFIDYVVSEAEKKRIGN